MIHPTAIHPRIAVCSWSLRPADADELAAALAGLGIGNVQLALNALIERRDGWTDAASKLNDAGITPVSGMFGTVGEDYSTLESIRRTGGIVPDETWEANWRIVQRVAPLAKSLGLRRVSTHAGFLPEHDDAKVTGRLRRIADLFADHGLTLLLETGQETAATLLRFLDTLDRDNVAANFDPANMILYDKGDPIEALRTLLPRIGQVHVKDAVRTRVTGTWGKEAPAGEGEVDWRAFVDTLEDGGYTGHYVIEREAGPERQADVTKAARLIGSLL